MAGEIFAAFRTVLLFISFSWLSIMYLLVYRVPRLEQSSCNNYKLIENGFTRRGENVLQRYESPFISHEGDIKIFGEDFPDLNLANPTKKLQFDSKDLDSIKSNMPESLTQASARLPEIHIDDNVDRVSGSFNCKSLESMQTLEVLGSGYTKVVRRGILNGKTYALKYTSSKNHDIVKCKSERPARNHFECYNLAKFKLLKEALLLRQLQHRNIIKVYGACPWTTNDVEGSESQLIVIAEIGQPLDVIKMIQIPWDVRLQMAIHLVELLLYLDDSPLGSLVIKDFRIEQLVVKNGILKLTDVDDVDGLRKPCSVREDCFVGGSLANTTLPCQNERCVNFAATSNLYHLYKIFLDYSLNYDNQKMISIDLKLIASKIISFQIGLKKLLEELQKIAWKLKSGIYARELIKKANDDAKKTNYEVFPDATIVGPAYDYYCLESRSLSSCEMVVSSIKEAKVICAMSSKCQAIVVTPEKNWLGQSVVVFKNSGRSLTPVTKYTTYVKVT